MGECISRKDRKEAKGAKNSVHTPRLFAIHLGGLSVTLNDFSPQRLPASAVQHYPFKWNAFGFVNALNPA
jgi:hypothetical protein